MELIEGMRITSQLIFRHHKTKSEPILLKMRNWEDFKLLKTFLNEVYLIKVHSISLIDKSGYFTYWLIPVIDLVRPSVALLPVSGGGEATSDQKLMTIKKKTAKKNSC